MKDMPAIYRGKVISKEHFRVYIYSPDDSKKLVESWSEFQKYMATGIWFSTKKEAIANRGLDAKIRIAKMRKSNKVKKEEEIVPEEIRESLNPAILAVIEKKDFLPETGS